jgi:hypothetical protein
VAVSLVLLAAASGIVSKVVATVLLVLVREARELPRWWLTVEMRRLLLLLLSLILPLPVTDNPIDVLQSQLQSFGFIAIAFHLEPMARLQLLVPATRCQGDRSDRGDKERERETEREGDRALDLPLLRFFRSYF